MPSRMPLSTGVSRASSVAYDTRVEDYLLSDRISNVDYLSNATLDYSDNTVRRSRGRDQQLLRDATNAIVSTETYATPQASAISRRVARGRSVAPRAASLPPRSLYPEQRLTERKAIRTEDGYTKPKNLLSWQYRLDAKMAPADLLYQPSSFIRIRDQVRNARDKMDLQRQLLDRYLPEGGADTGDVKASILRKSAAMEMRYNPSGNGGFERTPTVKIPAYYACGADPSNPPVSDLRRRIRRTLNKTRHSSMY